MNSFKNMSGNTLQDLMKLETYKRVLKGAIKEDLSKECLEISLKEVRNLGIFQDADSSKFLQSMDTLLALDKLLLNRPDFVQLCQKELRNYFEWLFNERVRLFFIKLLQNLNALKKMFMDPQKNIYLKLMLSLMMQQYEGVGLILRELVLEIDKMEIKEGFDYAGEYQLEQKFQCLTQIEVNGQKLQAQWSQVQKVFLEILKAEKMEQGKLLA